MACGLQPFVAETPQASFGSSLTERATSLQTTSRRSQFPVSPQRREICGVWVPPFLPGIGRKSASKIDDRPAIAFQPLRDGRRSISNS